MEALPLFFSWQNSLTPILASKREKKTSIYLAKIRQVKGEDLKEYLMQFNHKAMLISDLQDGVAYTTFLNRLCLEMLNFSLAKNKVITLVEALGIAQDFI